MQNKMSERRGREARNGPITANHRVAAGRFEYGKGNTNFRKEKRKICPWIREVGWLDRKNQFTNFKGMDHGISRELIFVPSKQTHVSTNSKKTSINSSTTQLAAPGEHMHPHDSKKLIETGGVPAILDALEINTTHAEKSQLVPVDPVSSSFDLGKALGIIKNFKSICSMRRWADFELVERSQLFEVGSLSDQIVDVMPLASLEDGRLFTIWVVEKFLRFGEFLGVSFEGKDSRVLVLLKDIKQETKEGRLQEFVNSKEGKVKSLGKEKEGEGKRMVY
ncbi:hypothetical protein HAX54_035750 [Datura stramonium]|uniref:Uncharacterized protein n=1 Tax=Datura stramonium TaxID=4076 RepID=A0ABS8SFK7_DATST|nr:hypothetical protein [Datura stramonium]